MSKEQATEFLRSKNIVPKDKTDLVIGFDNGTEESLLSLLTDFANSQPLNLDVKVDENWIPLEQPYDYISFSIDMEQQLGEMFVDWFERCKEYFEAKTVRENIAELEEDKYNFYTQIVDIKEQLQAVTKERDMLANDKIELIGYLETDKSEIIKQLQAEKSKTKELEALKVIYQNEVLKADRDMKRWKGKDNMLLNIAEQAKTSYQRVLEDLEQLLNKQ